MRLIIGLGNPGRDYAHNRHNVGFAVSIIWRKRMASPWDSEIVRPNMVWAG